MSGYFWMLNGNMAIVGLAVEQHRPVFLVTWFLFCMITAWYRLRDKPPNIFGKEGRK